MSILVRFINSKEVWDKVVVDDVSGKMLVMAETAINFDAEYEDDDAWNNALTRFDGEVEYEIIHTGDINEQY